MALSFRMHGAWVGRHAFGGTVKCRRSNPLDEGGMTFISLPEVGSEGFRAFARAVRLACSRAPAEAGFEQHEKRWAELLDILERDPRNVAGVYGGPG
jgi:hypothetical protein